MPGPVMTIRELYEAKKIIVDKRGNKREVFRYPHLRNHIEKKGPFYYVCQQDGKTGKPIKQGGKNKWTRLPGSARVWHRGKGLFSVYTGVQDKKLKKREVLRPKKGYYHTVDRKKR